MNKDITSDFEITNTETARLDCFPMAEIVWISALLTVVTLYSPLLQAMTLTPVPVVKPVSVAVPSLELCLPSFSSSSLLYHLVGHLAGSTGARGTSMDAGVPSPLHTAGVQVETGHSPHFQFGVKPRQLPLSLQPHRG